MIVNWVLPSLSGGSLEITLTLPYKGLVGSGWLFYFSFIKPPGFHKYYLLFKLITSIIS